MPVGLVAQSGEQVVEAVDAGVIKRVDLVAGHRVIHRRHDIEPLVAGERQPVGLAVGLLGHPQDASDGFGRHRGSSRPGNHLDEGSHTHDSASQNRVASLLNTMMRSMFIP